MVGSEDGLWAMLVPPLMSAIWLVSKNQHNRPVHTLVVKYNNNLALTLCGYNFWIASSQETIVGTTHNTSATMRAGWAFTALFYILCIFKNPWTVTIQTEPKWNRWALTLKTQFIKVVIQGIFLFTFFNLSL